MENQNHSRVAQTRLDLAVDFAVRMHSGDMSPQEEAAMEQWLQENPKNRIELQAVFDTWHSLGALAARKDEIKAQSSTRQSRSWKIRASYAVAASLILALTSYFVLQLQKPSITDVPELISYQTEPGEQKTVILDDGTEVALNTNTRLIIDFDDGRRRVTLDRGEAFFDVTTDVNRPFTVLTGARSVTVLGTRFNLMKSAFDLKVAVLEGLVAVHAAGGRVNRQTPAIDLSNQQGSIEPADNYRLSAGLAATFSGRLGSADAKVKIDKKIHDTYPEWKYGYVSFDRQPLYEVIKELNRYVKKKILIEDDRIMNMKVSGVFRLDEIVAAVNRIESAFPIRVIEHSDRMVIIGR